MRTNFYNIFEQISKLTLLIPGIVSGNFGENNGRG